MDVYALLIHVYTICILGDETTESFKWLFEAYLEATGGHGFDVLMTDHDIAMEAAIDQVLIALEHRLCIWHINKNIGKHMRSIMGPDYDVFLADFNKLSMNEYASPARWEAEWTVFLAKYEGMKGPLPYMRKLYEFRKKWAKAYHDPRLSCQIMASSRSEGYNALTKRFLSKKTTLSMVMSLLAEDTEVQKRLKTDFKDARDIGNNVLISASGKDMKWYTGLAGVVTSEVFEIVTQQFDASMLSYDMDLQYTDGVVTTVTLQAEGRFVRRLVVELVGSVYTIKSCDCYFHVSMCTHCRHMFHAVRRNDQPSCRWTIADSCTSPRWKRTVEREKVTFQLQVSNWLDPAQEANTSAAASTSSSTIERLPNSDLIHKAWYGSLLSKAKDLVAYITERKDLGDYEVGVEELDLVMDRLRARLEGPSATTSTLGALEESTPTTSLLLPTISNPLVRGRQGGRLRATPAPGVRHPTKKYT